MKRTILSFLLIGSAAAVMAQQPSPTNNSNLNSNRNNTTNPTNTSLNNNNNTNPSNNQNMTNPNPVNNSMDSNSTYPPNTTYPITNAGRDTTMSMSTNPTYNNSTNNGTNNKVNQPMNNSQVIASPEITSSVYSVNVPSSIQSSFTTNYPAVTGNTWMQSGDWYVTRYIDNGTIKQVSYREDGKTLTTTFTPTKSSFVSDDVMNQAIQRFGANVYSVAAVKGANGQDMYVVRVIENGQAKTEWINQDGSAADNHFRTEENQDMNVQQGQEQQTTTQTPTQTAQDSSMSSGNVNPDSSAMQMNNQQPQQSNTQQRQSLNSSQDQNQQYNNSSLNQEGINNASDTSAPKRKDQ